MSRKVGAQEMRDLAELVNIALHQEKGRAPKEVGFVVLTFDWDGQGMTNYISNGQRPDMVIALKEFIKKNETNQGITTPEEN